MSSAGDMRFQPSDEDKLVAAFAVRRDIQATRAARGDDVPQLRTAIDLAHGSLSTMTRTGLGEDTSAIYARLLDVVVAAEDVLIRILLACPEIARPTA